MPVCEKTYVNILMSKQDTVFCFFHISKNCVQEYEQVYGEDTWNGGTSVLKLFYIIDGIRTEKKQFPTDGLADNWYITLDDSDVDVFVELGRMSDSFGYKLLASSNVLTMPKSFSSIPPESYLQKVCYNETCNHPFIIVHNKSDETIADLEEMPLGSSW